MSTYTAGTHPIPMDQGPQTMVIALNGGTVTYQVMVDSVWVDDTVIDEDGRYTIQTLSTQGQMVITGGAVVSWRK